MSKTIWKFEVKSVIELPRGATILSVALQADNIFIWALVDPEAPKLRRKIDVYGTGHTIPEDPGTFVGTVLMHGGSFVFHIFDGGPA